MFWLAAHTLAGTGEVRAVAEKTTRLRRARYDPFLTGGLVVDGLHLEGARLHSAHLEHTRLGQVHLEHAELVSAHLEGADLTYAHLDSATNLADASVSDQTGWLAAALRVLRRHRRHGAVSVADVRWNGADLTVVDWSTLRRLGDEKRGVNWLRRGDAEGGSNAASSLTPTPSLPSLPPSSVHQLHRSPPARKKASAKRRYRGVAPRRATPLAAPIGRCRELAHRAARLRSCARPGTPR